MNKKLLAVIFATAIAGQSAQAMGYLKDDANWLKALTPTFMNDKTQTAQQQHGGQKYQTATKDEKGSSLVMNDKGKVQVEVDGLNDGEKQLGAPVGNYCYNEHTGEFFVLTKKNGLVEAKDSETGSKFVTQSERKLSKEKVIDDYFFKCANENSAANAFRAWRLKYFEKRWFAISSLAILATVVAISKKGFDLYQKHAAKKAVVNFDEFDDEDEEEVVDPAAAAQNVAEPSKTVEVESTEKVEKTA